MTAAPHRRIFAGFAVGALAGVAAHAALGGDHPLVERVVSHVTEPLGKLFLRALLLTVVPLVFSSLVIGVLGLGDLRSIGRVGARTLALTLVLSVASVALGLGIAHAVRPGERLDPGVRAALVERYGDKAREVSAAAPAKPRTFGQAVAEVVPDNPVAAVARTPPDLLGWMVFSLLFGIALASLPRDRSRPVEAVLEGVFDAVSALVRGVMWTAPVGVACLLFTMTARFGFDLLVSLAVFVAAAIGGLLVHGVGVYSLLIRFGAGSSPRAFFAGVREAAFTAFSTSSSNATLPTALRVAEEDLRVPRGIAGFVLTVGATANQNGTALFEGLTVLFLAQVFGVDLTLAQQATVMALAVVAGIGTAGIPSGSIPFIAMVLGSVGVPVEGIAIVLGVDRLLDMCRTVVNVVGDLAIAVVVAKGEQGAPAEAVA